MSTRYFLATASLDHIETAIQGGFMRQRNSGRMEKLKKGDKIVLYASKLKYEDTKGTCQQVRGVCTILDDSTESFSETTNGETYTVWKRQAAWEPLCKPIRPMLSKLSFITNPTKWGFTFMSGWREINKQDFQVLTGE